MEPQTTPHLQSAALVSDIAASPVAEPAVIVAASLAEPPKEVSPPEPTGTPSAIPTELTKPQIFKTEAKQPRAAAQPRGPVIAIVCAALFFVVLAGLAYYAYTKK